MSNHTTSASTAIVTINSVELRPIEIDSQRVVTLAMIDEVHGRPAGTAGRNFREHRHRLVEGKHFRELTADEIRRQSLTDVFPPRTPKGILITQLGYLKLVKAFNDDLAWDVQDMLVETYFKARETVSVARRMAPQISTAVAREVRLTNTWLERLAKAAGITGNQAIIAASQGTERMTGINPLALMGASRLPAPQNENLLCPTDIARRIGGVSARTVNLILTDLGLQTVDHDHKGRIQYEPTPAGVEAGGVMQDTSKKNGTGTPVRQLRWASSIVEVVRDAMQQEHAA